MKKLFSVLLIAVVATACKKESEPIYGTAIQMTYAISVETPKGESLFSKPQEGINPNLVRLRYYNAQNELLTYTSNKDRTFGTEYIDGPARLIIEIIPSNPNAFYSENIPYGYSNIINYVDWTKNSSDKIETTIHRFGNVIQVVKITVNDKLIWERKDNNTTPIIKKVIDGDNVYFEKVNAW